MARICIIPARGGSKRIPRKNVRPLLGRPLLAWTIETARRAGLFDIVIVSTDDDAIAAVAESAGARPFRRSAATATDTASTGEAILEVLEACEEAANATSACCLYATAALLRPEHLQEGARLMENPAMHDSAMAVQAYAHPIERALRREDGCIRPIDAQKLALRTQEIEPAYHDAGQFYFFRPEVLRATGRLLGARCAPVLLERWEAVDLDEEADWHFLEQLAAARVRPARSLRST